MGAKHVLGLAALVGLAMGCSGNTGSIATSDGGHHDTGGAGGPDAREPLDSGPPDSRHSPDGAGRDTGGPDAMHPTNNAAPMIVNAGPPKTGSFDVPFISVTLCVPGTMNCQTIDSMSVDTGASGVRVIASALSGSLALPQKNASDGNPLVECFTYADGFTWGSVRLADVRIAGELAGSIPIHVIADPAFKNIPRSCSSTGTAEDTVPIFGSYGTIGINQIVPDCGSFCASKPAQPAGYYSCAGATCSPVAVPVSEQIANPIGSFGSDNNGAVLEFPSTPADGEATLSGSLIFGIGTQTNNALGAATVLTVDGYGNLTTVFNGATLTQSYIDSGTNYLSFNDRSIPQCKASSNGGGFFCPPSTLSLTAENRGKNGTTSNVSFTIANANTLFSHPSYTAFGDIGGPGSAGSFAWGFPFFVGRNVFVALEGASTPGGKGPYVAY